MFIQLLMILVMTTHFSFASTHNATSKNQVSLKQQIPKKQTKSFSYKTSKNSCNLLKILGISALLANSAIALYVPFLSEYVDHLEKGTYEHWKREQNAKAEAARIAQAKAYYEQEEIDYSQRRYGGWHKL